MDTETLTNARAGVPSTLGVPASTTWPIVFAFGTTLLFAGLVTSAAVSVLGAVLGIAGAVGWFRDVLPHEAHEVVAVRAGLPLAGTARRRGGRLQIAGGLPPPGVPPRIYPGSAGSQRGA